MLKIFLRLWIGIAIATGATGMCAKSLKVGMELAYPPFEMSDKNGIPSGVSVDLAKELGKYLNRDVKIENIAWTGLIPSLKTKKVDIIISSMTITPQRQKVISFSIPYSQSNLAILTNPKANVKSIDDLNKKGKIVAVKQGSTGHTWAIKNLKEAKILPFDKENAAVLEVIQQKADGFLYDQLTIYKNWKKHEKTTIAILKPFQKKPEYWGIAMRKNDLELKQKVDEFIKKAKKDGTFDRISQKYLKEARETFDKLNIPFFF